MSGIMQNIIRSIRRKTSGSGKIDRRMFHLPDDLSSPDGFLILAGYAESDVWPALFLANTVQKECPGKKLSIICSSRDHELFNMLRFRPTVHSYDGNPTIPDSVIEDTFTSGTILLYPYAQVQNDMDRILTRIACGMRIAPLTASSPYINFRIKTESDSYPGILSDMCSPIGIGYDMDWRPVISMQMDESAKKSMAPISGRMLPYIATTTSAQSILEKSRAEIPLRTVSLSGSNSDFKDISRDLRTAIIADASAVATDSPDHWGDACAFGVPVVGLDRSGSFISWTDVDEPSDNESDFVEAWIRLLKKGW